MHSNNNNNNTTTSIPNGVPHANRKDAVAAMESLLHSHYPRNDVFGEGPMLLSERVQTNKDDPIILGIDEAGRGSVVGPMIYGMAYWSAHMNSTTRSTTGSTSTSLPQGLNDSKQLSATTRHTLFQELMAHPAIGFGVRVFHASEISRHMLRHPEPYNLNQMSHDATIALIRAVQDTTMTTLDTCYIDTVGNPHTYQRRLEREFPGVQFVVESKADDTYPVCSAASIVAKVTRDAMIQDMQIKELSSSPDLGNQFGSGYPSDPLCKKWMAKAMLSPIFGFPNIVRFSWAPSKQQIKQECIPMTFAADVEEDEDEDAALRLGRKRQQRQMQSFVSGKSRRLPYLERKRISPA